MNIITKSQILDFKDLPYRDIPVPEWTPKEETEPRMVRIQCITGLQRQAWYEALRVLRAECKDDEDAFVVRFQELKNLLLSMTMVNEENQPLFTKDETDAISKKNPNVTDKLFAEARTLCGMSQESQDDLEKN